VSECERLQPRGRGFVSEEMKNIWLTGRNNLLGLVSRLQGARKEDIRADGQIQWDKFILFYDILSIVSECQSKDPMISGAPSEVFKRLINDTPIINDEDVSHLPLLHYTLEVDSLNLHLDKGVLGG
jgi:hypothetical protein